MVSPPLTLRPVLVETGSADEDGCLVFAHDRLVAVFVRLSAAAHPDEASRGRWFLEAGFGPCAVQTPDVFPALADAEAWIRLQLAQSARPQGVRPWPEAGV